MKNVWNFKIESKITWYTKYFYLNFANLFWRGIKIEYSYQVKILPKAKILYFHSIISKKNPLGNSNTSSVVKRLQPWDVDFIEGFFLPSFS